MCVCWGKRVGGVVCVGVREWVAFGVCVWGHRGCGVRCVFVLG